MHLPAYPHDEIAALYPGVHLLHGSIKMGPGMRMNRNMVILESEQQLTLVNPVRMNESGLARLEELGTVKQIVRLGDFHGLDDAFYLERYQCDFWAQACQATYPSPSLTTLIADATKSPYPNSEFYIFESATYPEAALLLKEHKLLITTDSVQYHSDWRYFSPLSKFAFKLMGFKTGVNIGPPWLKRVTRKRGTLQHDFERLVLLDFDALVAAHGSHLKTGAKEALQGEMARAFK